MGRGEGVKHLWRLYGRKTKKRGAEDEVGNRQRIRDELWEEYKKDPIVVLRLALNKGLKPIVKKMSRGD